MKTMTARYSMPDNIPDYIKDLPEGAQRIFVDVFNAALDRGDDEDTARQAGWGAVKNVYEQRGEEWARKATEDMTLRYVALIAEEPPGDGDSGAKVSIVQVFRVGTWKHPTYGKFTITDDDLKTMADNFKKHKKPPTELVVDFEHMSAAGQQIAPAAGWVKALEAKDGKLLATVEWTDKAALMIKSKEYRFISPEWHMHAKDKESGKDIGPMLLSMALTNRPFIEGMSPVMLSEKVLGQIMPSDTLLAAEWDVEYINDLPDKSFAYVEGGGEKDEQGKTVPRTLRHMPYRNADGSVNLSHLRNALARLDQTSLSPEAKAQARKILEKAAEEAGVGEDEDGQGQKSKEEGPIVEDQIRELLGLEADADVLAAVKALKAKVDAMAENEQETEAAVKAKVKAEADLATATAKLTAKEVADDVGQALKDGHILPRQVDWAKSLRAKDPEGFKAFLASAPKIGPDGTIKGAELAEDAIQLTEAEVKVSKRLGVSEDALVAQKKADMAARKG